MPADFECRRCGLVFQVGWFHHARLTEAYGASSLLVCRGCGTQHRVAVASRDRGPEFIEHYDVVLTSVPQQCRVGVMARLRRQLSMSMAEAKAALARLPLTVAASVPIHDALSVETGYIEVGGQVARQLASRDRNPDFGPLARDRLWAAPGPRFAGLEPAPEQAVPISGSTVGPCHEFSLAEQRCGACGRVGQLASEAPDLCPHCHTGALSVVREWIT